MVNHKEKADLIIHPVRLRILQILADHSLTTGEISDRMPDVAKSSIYRHLRKLLDGGMVAVSEVKTVKGTAEKVFSCVVPPTISVQDIESMSKEDHLYYFSAYAATLIQGFKRYLDSHDSPDLIADRVGYREVTFYASNEEFDQLFTPFNKDILKLMNNSPVKGRKRRKLVVINHPETEETKDD